MSKGSRQIPAAEAAERIKELEEVLFEIFCLPSSREDEAHVLAKNILEKYAQRPTAQRERVK